MVGLLLFFTVDVVPPFRSLLLRVWLWSLVTVPLLDHVLEGSVDGSVRCDVDDVARAVLGSGSARPPACGLKWWRFFIRGAPS